MLKFIMIYKKKLRLISFYISKGNELIFTKLKIKYNQCLNYLINIYQFIYKYFIELYKLYVYKY